MYITVLVALCPKCKEKISVNMKNVNIMYTYDGREQATFKCPECNKRVHIEGDDE